MEQEQLRLPLITYYVGPQLVDLQKVRDCRSYREAVRTCWNLRTRRNMTQARAAEECGAYPSHFSDYIADGATGNKRDLPAKIVNDFEIAMGNRFVSQWLAMQAGLTILEQYLQRRAA
jgi:hypothetical protein